MCLWLTRHFPPNARCLLQLQSLQKGSDSEEEIRTENDASVFYLFSKKSKRFWQLPQLSFVLIGQSHTSNPPFNGESEKSGCDYCDCFAFCHTKLNQDSIFKDEVEMDIIKIDKSVCKNFNKAKEISSHFSFLYNIWQIRNKQLSSLL